MKKLLVFFLAFVIAMSAFGAGGNQAASGGKPEIQFWASGSDNVRLIFEELVDEFNKDPAYSSNCTVKLQFMPSGTGTQTIRDRLLAAYRSGQKNAGIDLAEFGEGELAAFLYEGGNDMFVRVDTSRLPNYREVTARPSQGSQFFIPYRGTTVIMAYNSDYIQNPPRTITELTAWIKANPTRFAYNSPDSGGAGSAFVTTQLYNPLPAEALLSTDEKWIPQWSQGWDYLKEIHPYLFKSSGKVVYPNRNQGTLDLLTSREIWMAPCWADQTITGVKTGALPASIKLYQMSPAFTGSLQVIGIPSFGSNPNEAHAFIDFCLSPKAQNILLADMAAVPLIPASKLDPVEAAYVKDLDVSDFRINSIGSLANEINRIWNETIAVLP